MASSITDMILAKGITLQLSELKDIANLRGNINRRDVAIDGVDYMAGELVFKGFQGQRHDGGECTGEYKFRYAQPDDENNDLFDFTALPSWPTAVIVLP